MPPRRFLLTEVCLCLEGTYPYVPGGVSSWVHAILQAFPTRKFSLFHISPYPGAYSAARFDIPENVVKLNEVYCLDAANLPRTVKRHATRNKSSDFLNALYKLHLSDRMNRDLVADLATADMSMEDFLHGQAAFDFIRDLYDRFAPEMPFIEFFWQMRAMHIPLIRLLRAPSPKASCYHAVSTGYAGIIGAVASARTGRPLLVTEHGLYAHEREMELQRAPWLSDATQENQDTRYTGQLSPLRRLWSRYFYRLSQIAYCQAQQVVTLSEVNRRKQVTDGLDIKKTLVVPNGVDPKSWSGGNRICEPRPIRIGFVGRVVPIKDVVTFIQACHIALQSTDFETWIIGPEDEDPQYARLCKRMITVLGRQEKIRFLGPQSTKEMYPQLDILVLTSLSEGQPLVILEGHAAGLPVIATDVGACPELLLGRNYQDTALGASGIVTKVSNPGETARAMVTLCENATMRHDMGRIGQRRIEQFYQLKDVLMNYDELYSHMVRS